MVNLVIFVACGFVVAPESIYYALNKFTAMEMREGRPELNQEIVTENWKQGNEYEHLW